jgi:hypothetical protein
MDHFMKHFRRDGRNWICIGSATFDGPQGRIQVTSGTILILGAKFMNVDLAQLLDDEYMRQHAIHYSPAGSVAL